MTAKIRFIFRLLCIAGCLYTAWPKCFFCSPFTAANATARDSIMVAARARFLRHETANFRHAAARRPRSKCLISNHISWLDIMAVNGAFPGRFVAKDDVAKWPVVGYLATQAQTVYVSRNRGIKGNSAKIAGVTEALKKRRYRYHFSRRYQYRRP